EGHLRQRAVARDAGVVHEHVDRPERLLDLLHHARDRGGIAHVALEDLGAAVGGADLRAHGLGLLGAAEGGYGHRRAGAGELERDSASDPARAAGHQGHLAGEETHDSQRWKVEYELEGSKPWRTQTFCTARFVICVETIMRDAPRARHHSMPAL